LCKSTAVDAFDLTLFLYIFCNVVGKEKKANLKIVKYLHFPLAGYA